MIRVYELIMEPLRRGQFKATLDGSTVVASTHEPLLAGARALLALGVPPDSVIQTRHAGSPHISMRSTVGAAAALTVLEPKDAGIRFRRWKEFPKSAFASSAPGSHS
jgi:hypothetical protein